MRMTSLTLTALLLTSSSVLALEPGDSVPAFSAKNQDDKTITQAAFKDHYTLVYFYPKDDTPGCTQQACALRDEFAKFKKENGQVFGVSRQDALSHQAFKKKHKLQFDLLVDQDGKLAEKLGIELYSDGGLHKRQSVLFGPDARLIKRYPKVEAAGHATVVLADIQADRAAKKSKK